MQWDWTVKVTDLAIVFATLFGPIVAILAQGQIDRSRERRRRREALFFSLMRTRATPLSTEHVNALNQIPLEFSPSDRRSKRVRSAWRAYLNHFNTANNAGEAWMFRRTELLNKLLSEIGAVINFEVDPVEVETGIYAPQAHVQMEQQTNAIREGLAKLLAQGELPMSIKAFPPGDDEMRESFRRVVLGFDAWLARANEAAESSADKSAD